MVDNMKTCKKCKVEKELNNFGRCSANKDGINNWCKPCNVDAVRQRRLANPTQRKEYNSSVPDKIKTYSKTYRTNNKEARKNSLLKVRYGITLEQYNDLYQRQNAVCAVCHKPNSNGKPLFVDHNHTTGQVRGLLCSTCNTALGMLQEDITIISNLAEYLKLFI